MGTHSHYPQVKYIIARMLFIIITQMLFYIVFVLGHSQWDVQFMRDFIVLISMPYIIFDDMIQHL